MMKKKIFSPLLILILLYSCTESRVVKYAGFDDLAAGIYEIKLFDNGEFLLELNFGSTEGTYQLNSDTLHLNFYDTQINRPKKWFMTKEKFISLESDGSNQTIKISRIK